MCVRVCASVYVKWALKQRTVEIYACILTFVIKLTKLSTNNINIKVANS